MDPIFISRINSRKSGNSVWTIGLLGKFRRLAGLILINASIYVLNLSDVVGFLPPIDSNIAALIYPS